MSTILLSLAGLAADTQSPSARPAGKITSLLPVDFVLRGPESLEAAVKMPVFWGDIVKTERGGRVRVRLDDGSVLNVGSNSSLVVQEHDAQAQETSLGLSYGRIRAKVVRIVRPGGSFKIRTPVATTGVVGTDQYVETTATETIVIALGGGQVTVRSTDSRYPELIVLDPGETVTFAAGRPPTAKRAATVQELLRAVEETALGEALSLARGISLPAVLLAAVDAKKNKVGDIVTARTIEELKSDGIVIVPKNGKLIGRVVVAQARTKTNPESRLAIAFDRVAPKKGAEVPIQTVLQAVAAPELPPAGPEAEMAFGGAESLRGGTVSAARPSSGPTTGGLLGGVTSTAGSATGPVASAASTLPGQAGARVGPATSAAGATPGNIAGFNLSSSGIFGLDGILLQAAPSNALSTPLVVSRTRNVRLDTGTRMILRVAGPQ